MVGADRTLVHQEVRTMRRKVAAEMREKKEKTAMVIATEVAILDDSFSDDSTFTLQESEAGRTISKAPRLRGTTSVVTHQFEAAFDTNTSDRNAAHIFSAMASTNQLKPHRVEDLIIYRRTIRRARSIGRDAQPRSNEMMCSTEMMFRNLQTWRYSDIFVTIGLKLTKPLSPRPWMIWQQQ